MNDTFAVILAAGKGTRMKSKLYKVLHPVCGKPMVQHVIDSLSHLKLQETIVVVGHGAEEVKERVSAEGISYVLQEEQLGTGHAVKMAKDRLQDRIGDTLILCGDTPLLTTETLQSFIHFHQKEKADVTVLTTQLEDPTGYGRIVRNAAGEVNRIVEQKDANEEEKQIKEINTGVYLFSNEQLMDSLNKIQNNNSQGEYYLTDCIQILFEKGKKVLAYLTNDPDETMGVNDRVALAEAEQIMKKRINQHHMRAGVTIIDPQSTYIGTEVEIGSDTILHPGTIITGKTQIGQDCVIGPHTELRDAKVGDQSVIQHSVVIESCVGKATSVGPFAYIRPGSEIGDHCKVGDFVEVKNSKIGNGSKIPHLSYVGDAEIGQAVNMGCGSITVNYDGQKKHLTQVGDGSFVGCNVNLIAPVEIGAGSYIAAGSTITDSTPSQSFAIARERQVTKENYAERIKGIKK